MSHHPRKEEKISCPNCGHNATKNYCAQCGQQTHLHKENFFGLILHFVGHYFHYDSKGWQTLKTLLTKPGKLTVAYWEKKRMRYLPPVSLYIFVSAVFFLFFFSTVATKKNIHKMSELTSADSIAFFNEQDSIRNLKGLSPDSLEFIQKGAKIKEEFTAPGNTEEFLEGAIHAFPKLFFFMIPVMGFVLKLLYVRRKDAFFVDHAVFSLHIHSFVLLLALLVLYHGPDVNTKWYHEVIDFLQSLVKYVAVIYLVIAIHNAYKSGWIRSFLYSLVIIASYIVVAFIIFLLYFMAIAVRAAM